MNCINLRIRSSKYIKYYYCVISKKEIEITDCKCCSNKKYKETKKIKAKVSKRAKAVDISEAVKQAVAIRDNNTCVICNIRPGIPNMHYIRRSQGGLGIEQNVACGCIKCHNDYDNGSKLEENREIIRNHLQNYYGDSWNEADLVYKKL